MKIGVDFDGVIVRVDEEARAKISDALAKDYGIRIVNPKARSWEQRYGRKLFTDKDLEAKFRYQYFERVVAHEATAAGAAGLSPMPNAAEAIKRLKKLKHRLYLITSRGGERNEQMINKKLDDLGLIFDQCHFDMEQKVQTAKDLGIDVMIDDKYSNVRQMAAANIPVIQLISQGSGAQQRADGIKGVQTANNWNEITAIIEQMSSKPQKERAQPPKLHQFVSTGDIYYGLGK
jgi:beta-phosphoglucomutase-like phosphatase (HAD superfamily)